jgi:putative transposase
MDWHNRRSIRIKGFDYCSPGFYFVTICTNARIRLLGHVENRSVTLSKFGAIVFSIWKSLPDYFPFCRIDSFVIMPDHLHGVLEFKEGNVSSLDVLIRTFKSLSTRRIHNIQKRYDRPVWQRNYYEHVIRTEKELNLIRIYIDLNPRMWAEGKDMNSLELKMNEIERLLSMYPKQL